MVISKAILAALSAATLSAGAVSAEEQILKFKLVVSMTSDAELSLASVPDRGLAAHEALGVAYFEDGRLAFKQFVVSSVGGEADGDFIGLSTYTFQNGDSITAKFTGAWTGEGEGGDYVVLSGTGAYAGATGTGRFDGVDSAWDKASMYEGSFTLDVPGT